MTDHILPQKESEMYAPSDRSPGFKPWDTTRDRYWMGTQWSDTYRQTKED